jgi:hypothetical protein
MEVTVSLHQRLTRKRSRKNKGEKEKKSGRKNAEGKMRLKNKKKCTIPSARG